MDLKLNVEIFRIAMSKRESMQRGSVKQDGGGIWGMIKSVTYSSSNESIL